MAPARRPNNNNAAQKKKDDDAKMWWFGIIVLGSLCLQCYILSVYSKFRTMMTKELSSSSPRYIPTGMVHRTNAALAFVRFLFCFFLIFQYLKHPSNKCIIVNTKLVHLLLQLLRHPRNKKHDNILPTTRLHVKPLPHFLGFTHHSRCLSARLQTTQLP